METGVLGGAALREGDIVLVESYELDLREYAVVRGGCRLEWLSRPYLKPELAYWLERGRLTVVGRADQGIPPHLYSAEYCRNADT